MALLPPLLEGIIPAFYGNTITIPFTMNAGVEENEIIKFPIKIKSLQTNNIVDSNDDIPLNYWNKNNMTISYLINTNNMENFIVGSHYKI